MSKCDRAAQTQELRSIGWERSLNQPQAAQNGANESVQRTFREAKLPGFCGWWIVRSQWICLDKIGIPNWRHSGCLRVIWIRQWRLRFTKSLRVRVSIGGNSRTSRGLGNSSDVGRVSSGAARGVEWLDCPTIATRIKDFRSCRHWFKAFDPSGLGDASIDSNLQTKFGRSFAAQSVCSGWYQLAFSFSGSFVVEVDSCDRLDWRSSSNVLGLPSITLDSTVSDSCDRLDWRNSSNSSKSRSKASFSLMERNWIRVAHEWLILMPNRFCSQGWNSL